MKGGAATGPSPVDRGKTGSKHHVIVEAYGIPAGHHPDRRQPPRRHPPAPVDRGRAADPRQARPAAPPATAPVYRPRIPTAASTTRPIATGSAPCRSFRTSPGAAPKTAPASASPLGRGRSDRFAALVPPPALPLGDLRRHPPGVRHPRLRHHLLATPARIRQLGGITLFHSV